MRSKAIVNLHSDPVKPFPPAVDRNDKRKMVNKMRRVFTEQSALAQSFEHKGNISLWSFFWQCAADSGRKWQFPSLTALKSLDFRN